MSTGAFSGPSISTFRSLPLMVTIMDCSRFRLRRGALRVPVVHEAMVSQSSLGALVMRRRPGADPGDGHHGAEQARGRVHEEGVLDAADQTGHRGAGRNHDGGVDG